MKDRGVTVKKIMKLFILIYAMCGFFTLANAESINVNSEQMEFSKVVYVDAGIGDDETGDGTVSRPYKTFNKAYSMLPSGIENLIYLKKGNYICSVNTYDLKEMSILGEGGATRLNFDYSQIDSGDLKYGNMIYAISKLNIYKLTFGSNNTDIYNGFIAKNSGSYINFNNVLFDFKGTSHIGIFCNLVLKFDYCSDFSNKANLIRSDFKAKTEIANSQGLFNAGHGTLKTDYLVTNSLLNDDIYLNADYSIKTPLTNMGVYNGKYSWGALKSPKLVVNALSDKVKLNNKIIVDISFENVSDIYAEDFKINYDSSKLKYLGAVEKTGYKICLENKDGDNIRFIVASKGSQYKIVGGEVILQLQFEAISKGLAKVDATKARIANVETELEILTEDCGENVIEIESIGDVNLNDQYTLVDLAIDGFFYGVNVNSIDSSKYNADQVVDSNIDDFDLVSIANNILLNSSYSPNN